MEKTINARASYLGIINESAKFIEKIQSKDRKLWAIVTSVFRDTTDERTWRCEYWGKLMRGACIVYRYTHDEELYEILEETILDLLSCQREDGSFTAYSPKHEFTEWDVWCRKYVMYGFLYFLDICKDEKLVQRIEIALIKHADCIIKGLGKKEEGKIEITDSSIHWLGVNSCSILRPFVLLYKRTKDKKYLAFAEYIISTGGIREGNLIELASKGELAPYQYPETKAYETISFFEGVNEYAVLMGDEKLKEICVKFADKILETDFTLIGGTGCDDELFDHSSFKQVSYMQTHMQETCVTVTLMQYLCRIFQRTGDGKYVDAIERSFYNTFLGAINWRFGEREGLQFDSYSPILGNRRGLRVGGKQPLPDGSYYGCCAAIGAAGFEAPVLLGAQAMADGLTLSFYEEGEIVYGDTKIICHTGYPYDGKIVFNINTIGSKKFYVALRIPAYSKAVSLSVNGEEQPIVIEKGYVRVEKNWETGDCIELTLDTSWVYHEAKQYNAEVDDRFALSRGPIVYAVEADKDVQLSMDSSDELYKVKPTENNAYQVATGEGNLLALKPYFTCGTDWIGNVTVWVKK